MHCTTQVFYYSCKQALKPGIKVFAAEPELADDCAKSFAAGKIIPNKTFPNTIADALK